MGCCCGSEGVKLEIVYCESCGWSKVAKKVIESIRDKHANVFIDCHPANGYTGLIQVFQIADSKKKQLFSGSKQEALARQKEIAGLIQ